MEYLRELFPDSPRTRIKKLLQGETVRVNDKPVTFFAAPLKPGDIVEVNRQAGNLTEIAYDSDYYDQAHFTRDFREFTGITPREFPDDAGMELSSIFHVR